jgi:peptidase M28-like protein
LPQCGRLAFDCAFERAYDRGVNYLPWLVLPVAIGAMALAQNAPPAAPPTVPAMPAATAVDAAGILVARLQLESYKSSIRALTRFGDRRQGTDRNRAAIDWIETELKSFGCSNTNRLQYTYSADAPRLPSGPALARLPDAASGGARYRGVRNPTGVNEDPMRQPDETLRALDTPPSVDGPREEVYCTKIGTVHPEEMYLVGAHMDGIGWGEAANDDGSGAAVVMELARILSAPDVRTERSIRFVLWNNEETGLDGARAYVAQRASLQGKEDPAGSGQYPEPRWLGMIQHDMVLFDHGMPHADGSVPAQQRPEADVNIEFQSTAAFADGAQQLAWALYAANEAYATDYPAAVGPHMTNTDSTPFMDLVPAISVRENERGREIGAGWDPHWHQPTDLYTTFSDQDFRLGLNAAQTTLGALARLSGASLRR